MKPLEIQNVIEEVTRRVIALSDSAFGDVDGDVTGVKVPEIPVLGDKVISTQQLNDLPDGLTRIQVDCKSLITPAAADWLSEQKIDVQRVDVPATGESPNAVNGQNRWICLTMGSAMAGFESFDCIVKASRRCDEAINNGDLVVLVTDSTSVALIALNRNQKLRAIEVRHINELQKGAIATYANVFVVCKKSHQTARLINQIKLVPQYIGSPPDWL
ncbi:MAG: hypothetical protein NZ744_16020 [Pirellulaceae bacterium]|nr:hypothetical protein [Pirellulaceae bacterium]